MQNTQYKIEKNIPVPHVFNDVNGYKGLYPFPLMKIGDSFLVKCSHSKRVAMQTAIIAAANWYKQRWDKKARYVTRSSSTGVRIWRVK